MKKTKLKDICNISAGGTPSRSNINYWNNGDIPWCKIGDFSGKYINQVKENITEEGLKNSSAKIFKRGTILYTIFATVGEVAILETESATNQAIAGLEIINNEVDLEYLYYYLKSLKFVMLKKSRGVAQNNINLGILKNIEIKIPDKIEQINIAKILDNIEKIIDKKKKQLKELNTIIKSQFVEMFENNKFEKKNLGDVAIKITDGSHNPPKGVDERTEYVMLSSQNIIEDKINYNNARYLSRKDFERENKRTYLEKGDVLLTIVGTIGRTAVIDKEKNITLQRSVAVIKPIEKIKSEYLVASLKTDSAINQLNKRSKGVAQKGIYLNDLKKIFIPVPPITLQNQFSKIVKQIDKQKFESMIQLDKENRIVLKNIIKDTLEETNSIYEFLFKKYFEKGK